MRNWKNIISALCSLFVMSTSVQANPLVHNQGLVFQSMKEQEPAPHTTMNVENVVEQIIKLPELNAPFDLTTEMLKNYPDAQPADGVMLLSLPQANRMGSATMSYELNVPPMPHDMKPNLQITYNSDLSFGNMGSGWNLNLPKITLDSTVDKYDSYRLNDEKLYFLNQKPGKEHYVAYVNKGFILADKISVGSKSYWEVTDAEGVKHIFGKVILSKKEKSDGKDSIIAYRNVTIQSTTQIAEWYETRAENFYGDYIDYVYSTKNDLGSDVIKLDTIKLGTKKEDYPRVKMIFSWRDNKNTITTKGYGGDFTISKRLTKIQINYIKDYSTANELPKKEDEMYQPLYQYQFDYEEKEKHVWLKSIAKGFGSNGILSQTHQFEYYDDLDSVKKYREYRDEYFDLRVDSFIKDRTGLLKTIHTPFGGCISLDYEYAERAKTFGDTMPDSLFVPMDTLLMYKENRDTLLLNYFHRNDTTKGKWMMTSLWVNDAFAADGSPSRNLYFYERPMQDSLGNFIGFQTVTTCNMDTRKDSAFVYRKLKKEYDSTCVETRPLLLRSTLANSEDSILKETTFSYYTYYISTTSTNGNQPKLNVASRGKGLLFNPIKEACTSYGRDIYDRWCYTYDSAYPLLQTLSHSGAKEGTDFDRELKWQYNYDENRLKGLVKTIQVTDGTPGTKFYSAKFDYTDKKNPFSVTRMEQAINNGGDNAVTDFQYDADGNMITRILPGEEKRMTYRYLYDQRFNQFITRVDDSHGYRSEWLDYNYHYGLPQILIDRNYQKQRVHYDLVGRIDTVVAPKEMEVGEKFTIRYEYEEFNNPTQDSLTRFMDFQDSLVLNVPDTIYANDFSDSLKKFAISHLLSEEDTSTIDLSTYEFCDQGWPYDTFNITVDRGELHIPSCLCDFRKEPIKAYTYRYNALNSSSNNEKYKIACNFADGMGRTIQTQNKMEVYAPDELNDGINYQSPTASFVASCVRMYDPYGRISNETVPMVNAKETTCMTADDTKPSYRFEYDVQDRVTQWNTPRGDSLVITYPNVKEAELKGAFGYNGQPYVVINETRTFDLFNHEISRNCKSGDNKYEEDYQYDAMGRMTHIQKGTQIINRTYDLLGRIIKSVDSQKDTTTYEYDKAGNLSKKNEITYQYDYDLLTDIHYRNTTENVHFTYGDKNAPFNRVGRVAIATNATNVQEFYYDQMGEQTKERRTVIIPDGSVETFTTETFFDSWGNLSKVIYPDGEILTYYYNINGLPISAEGQKAYSYNYVKEAAYNECGNITHFTYCNGAETFCNYRTGSNWLWNMIVRNKHQSGSPKFFSQSIGELGAVVELNTFSQKLYRSMHQYSNLGNLTWETFCPALSAYYPSLDGNSYGIHISYGDNNVVKSHSLQSTENNESYAVSYNHEFKTDAKTGKNMEVALETDTTVVNSDRLMEMLTYGKNGEPVSIVESVLKDGETADDVNDYGGDQVYEYAYDEENRISAFSNNGYLSTFWYDVFGNRSLQMNGGHSSIFVNAENAWNGTTTPNYTFYLNRYFEKNSEGTYVKHIWLGNQRMVSKVGDNASYGSNPSRIERAGSSVDAATLSYDNLYSVAQASIANRYGSMNTAYPPTNKTCPSQSVLRNANVDNGNDNYEEQQYYYHTDRNCNAMLMTDLKCDFVQQVLMLLTGKIVSFETYGEKDSWVSPYFFNNYTYDFTSDHYFCHDKLYNSDYKFNLGYNVWWNTYLKDVSESLDLIETK